MGHYESAYAHDAEVERKDKAMQAQRIKDNLDGMNNTIRNSHVKVPPRFTAALEDFDNWLKATYNVT